MIQPDQNEHLIQLRLAGYLQPFPSSPCFWAGLTFQAADDQQYYDHLQLLLQEAERLCFKSTTKYLAKKYFDSFLVKEPRFPPEKAILLMITCLRIAAKFYETVEVSSHYSIEYCIAQSGGQFTKQEFLDCEIHLLGSLNFKLSMTSPYDFVVKDPVSQNSKQNAALLNTTIDFALSIPCLRTGSAEGIFFGALIYTCKQKNKAELVMKKMKELTGVWKQAEEIAGILDRSIEELLQE